MRNIKRVHDVWDYMFIDNEAGQMGSWFVRWFVIDNEAGQMGSWSVR